MTSYCRDCIHIRPSQNHPGVARYARCSMAKIKCPVDGHDEMLRCFEARGANGPCGPDARLFRLKEKAA